MKFGEQVSCKPQELVKFWKVRDRVKVSILWQSHAFYKCQLVLHSFSVYFFTI